MSSINYGSPSEKYTNPSIPQRTVKLFDYKELRSQVSSHGDLNMNEMPIRQDYPKKADHSRFPVMINCQSCNKLCMTDIQYQHGTASKLWCIVLLPFFCTGCCCLCLNSCKDVKHICSECRQEAGICKSQCC